MVPYGLQKNLQHKFQILQNKTITFFLDLTPRSHIGYSKFNRLNWLPDRYWVQQIVSTNTHRLVYGNAPLYLREGISIIHFVPGWTVLRDKSFSCIADKFWNQLLIPMRTTENPLHFQSLIKKQNFDIGEKRKRKHIYLATQFLVVGNCI